METRCDSGWIQTASGKRFWPLEPRPEDIDIDDVAHALSQLCRFTGHTRWPYSVAQHSVEVSRIVPDHVALEGLLHDAAEAYMADVARPVKRSLMHVLGPIEERLERCIAERFDLVYPWPADVKRADDILLATERRDVMKSSQPWRLLDGRVEPLVCSLTKWTAVEAKQRFLARFCQLHLARAQSKEPSSTERG